MAGNGRAPGESVAGKLFAVMDAFAGDRTELTTAEIARSTGLPPSTLSRLLRSLVQWGGLTRSPTGEYRVGVKLWEIATRFPIYSDLRSAALPFLQDLFAVTEAHVGLCILESDECLIVEKFPNPSLFPGVGRVGSRLPLHASAMGKVLLAFSSAEIQEQVLTKPLVRLTKKTLTEPEAVRRELAEVRRQRYAVSDGDLVPQSLAIAAPICGVDSRVLGAISVVVDQGAPHARQLTMAVRSCAFSISRYWQSMPPEQLRNTPPVRVVRTVAPMLQH